MYNALLLSSNSRGPFRIGAVTIRWPVVPHDENGILNTMGTSGDNPCRRAAEMGPNTEAASTCPRSRGRRVSPYEVLAGHRVYT